MARKQARPKATRMPVVGFKMAWADDLRALKLTLQIAASDGGVPTPLELAVPTNCLSELRQELEKYLKKYRELLLKKQKHDAIDRNADEMRSRLWANDVQCALELKDEHA